MVRVGEPVPEWSVGRWFGDGPETLASLRGSLVVVHTFQMLCPGCIYRAIPQALRLHELLRGERAVLLGLHTVFEHHAAMRDVSLEAFLHELRVPFPVGVDEPHGAGGAPLTMRRWQLGGTPSTLVVDPEGRLAHRSLGSEDDLTFGLRLGKLLGAGARAEEPRG